MSRSSGTRGTRTFRVTAYVTAEELSGLQEHAEVSDRTVSLVVRRAIREYLQRENAS